MEETLLIGEETFIVSEVQVDTVRGYNAVENHQIMGGKIVSALADYNGIKMTLTVPIVYDDLEEALDITKYHGTFQTILFPYLLPDELYAYITVKLNKVTKRVYEYQVTIEEAGRKEEYLPYSDKNGFILESEE